IVDFRIARSSSHQAHGDTTIFILQDTDCIHTEAIAKDPQHFRQIVVFLVDKFWIDNSLLKQAALIIRRLCVLLNAERVYRELSTILEGKPDLDFASIMVQ
ncbi:hypothetical protein S245_047887, partial [Arachis hypogaea]